MNEIGKISLWFSEACVCVPGGYLHSCIYDEVG